ncbi:MAG: metallophosphoesterase family protein, partial [Gaiellaceae bacterium]
ALALAAVLALAAQASARPDAGSAPVATLIAAGDIASCSSDRDEATARLLDGLAGTVAVLGDAAYERGTDAEFARCYAPSWGRHRGRTRPAPGNHEYETAGAAGYFRYFGAAAGPPRGYYSYDLGAWHVVVLNSNCSQAGGCRSGSPQERWLRADLAAHPARCTLAYSHHPRFSSGLHGSTGTLADLWRALYAAGADVVLAGHDHHYERFRPQTPAGKLDPRRGLREFVVGTGGRSLRPVFVPLTLSQVRNFVTYGVLVLRLEADGYSWRFVPVPGRHFRDAGSARCH